MNKTILNAIIQDFLSHKTKLILCTLTYYTIIAFIPTFFVVSTLFEILNISTNISFLNSLDITLESNSYILILSIISLYLLSRIFFSFLEVRFELKKAFLYSFLLSFTFIVFLCFFVMSFMIKTSYLRTIFRIVSIAIGLLIISNFLEKKNFKYSLIFSIPFSLIINLFFYLFEITSSRFIAYENYYGFFAPLFVLILEIHIVIHIIYLYYLFTTIYTKISNIKFIKL